MRFKEGHIFVLGLCLGLRLAAMLAIAPWLPEAKQMYFGSHDQGYHRLAINLMYGKGYIWEAKDIAALDPTPSREILAWKRPGEPETLWPPGYPAFLAVIYTLFGVSVTAVLIAQALFATISCWFLIHATESLSNKRAGLLAGGLYATEPTLILLTNSIRSEGIFIPLLCIIVFLLSRLLTATNERNRLITLVGLGITMGIATWIRVNTVFILCMLIFMILIIYWQNTRCLLRSASWVALIGVIYLTTLIPWYWRNYRLFGEWAFSTSASYNLLEVYKYRDGEEAILHKAYLKAVAAGEDPQRLTPFQRARYWRQTALDEWRTNFGSSGRLYLTRLAFIMTNPGLGEWGKVLRVKSLYNTHSTDLSTRFQSLVQRVHESGAIGIVMLAYVILYLTIFYISVAICLVCWRIAFSQKVIRQLALITFFASSMMLLTSINNIGPRMRSPAIVLLIPVVALGLTNLLMYKQQRVDKWVLGAASNKES